MGLLKFALLACVLVGGLGLVGGIFRVVEDDPSGGVRFAPRVSKPTLRWYVAKASDSLSELDQSLKSDAR
jgi:hypothetical protein